ncbi:MAG: Ig-like domain-containing protein [Bacteroidota bacterium]
MKKFCKVSLSPCFLILTAAFLMSGFFVFAGIASAATTSSLIPSGQGFYTAWTNGVSAVNEGIVSPSCNSSDSVIESTSNDRESFTLDISSISNGSTIQSIAISVVDRGDDNPNGTYQTFTRLNGSNQDSGVNLVATGGSGDPCSSVKTQNINVPDTIKSGTTTLEIGVVKTTTNSTTVRVGAIVAVITYSLPDTTPPVIAAHENITTSADSLGGATVNYTLPTATDNVDPVVTVTCAPAPGSYFIIAGSPHTVTCNAQDAAGNNATPTTFTVTVNPGPVDANQSSVTTSTNSANLNSYVVVTITAKDQYGNPISGIAPVNVVIAVSGGGNTVVQPVVATDSNGQTTGSFTSTVQGDKTVSVTINGTTLIQQPQVTFTAGNPANAQITSGSGVTVEASLSGTSVTLDIYITDANQNPVNDNIVIDVTASTLAPQGTPVISGSGNTVGGHITRTLNFDYKGDVSIAASSFSGALSVSGDSIIHFVDTTKPVISLIGTDPVSVEYRGTYTDDGATASDNIDEDVTTSIVTVNPVDTNTVMFNPANPGQIIATYTVTYDVVDGSGNAADQVTRTVNVIDTTKPVITSIVSDATSSGVLKIGDTINFTLTPTPAEPIAIVNGSYNGHTLTWSTSDEGATYIAVYTVTEGDTDQTLPLQITGVTMTDEAGNVSDPADGTDVVKTIDANRPTVSSVDSDGETYNLLTISPHTIKITFNEDISSVPSVDVNMIPLEPQTVTDCGDADAKTFCFDYVIDVPEEITHRIYVSDAQDMAGNTMLTDNSHTFIVDTLAPVLAEITPVTNPTNDLTPDYTFNSSEAGAITYGGSCGNGNLTIAVADNNTTTYGPLSDATYSDCEIVVTDAAGNPSATLPVSDFTVDTASPTVTLDSTAPDPTNIKPIPVTVHFSEPVSDFDETDVSVTNGAIVTESFLGSGTDYSFNVTPAGSDPEMITVSVDIASDVAHDSAGNGNDAATTLSRIYDTVQPAVVSIILKEGSVTSDNLVKTGDILTINVEFSEAMAESPAPQISITGANTLSATDMARIDATHYTYDFTVGSGDGEANIAVNGGTDLAGNSQVEHGGPVFTVDNTLPVIDQHDPIVDVANVTGGKIVNYEVTASDTHDGAIIPICSPASGFFFPVSETTPVTCNATDQAGNAAEQMLFDVTINPDVITHIVLLASPIELAFSDESLITVTGYDQYNNVVTNNSETTVVLSADGGGSLDNTILALNEGVATAHLSKDSAGIVHVTASSEGLGPKQVTVTFTETDTSSPYVESHTPINGATNVALNVHPVLVFDEPLDTVTVSSANIQLRKYSDDSMVPASVSPAEGDRQTIITPTNPLDFDTQYYFSVSADVTDKVGNPAIPYDKEVEGNIFTTIPDNTVLSVTGISAIKTYATADGTYENGWSWTFNVTVPTAETELQMKFDDWASALLTTIPVANNIRYSSAQASNGPIEIIAANTYGDPLHLTGDLDSGVPGRQIQILVEARVPEGSAGGSYSTSFGIQSLAPTD